MERSFEKFKGVLGPTQFMAKSGWSPHEVGEGADKGLGLVSGTCLQLEHLYNPCQQSLA